MARYCLIKSEQPSPTEGWKDRVQYTTWCGRTEVTKFILTRSPDQRSLCPKCAQKHAMAELAKTDLPYKLGDRLDLSDHPLKWDFKSIYPILDTSRHRDDQEIGFVAIENGWGKQWKVYSWTCIVDMHHASPDVPLPEPRMTNEPVWYRREADKAEREGAFKSKESCLLHIPAMIRRLPSRQAVLAGAQAEVEEMRTRRREREQADLERQKRRQAATADRDSKLQFVTERFRAMLGGNLPLLDDDQEALRLAARLLGVDLSQEAEKVAEQA